MYAYKTHHAYTCAFILADVLNAGNAPGRQGPAASSKLNSHDAHRFTVSRCHNATFGLLHSIVPPPADLSARFSFALSYIALPACCSVVFGGFSAEALGGETQAM